MSLGELKILIRRSISEHLIGKDRSIFTILQENLNNYCETQTAHSISELKRATSKKKGDIFEILCKELILLNCMPRIGGSTKNVWLCSELPEDIRNNLSLRKQDLGIDIIVELTNNKYVAIQCKYRKRPRKRTIYNGDKKINIKWAVPWRELATFYSLCDRTGPKDVGWTKTLVITNCESALPPGRKSAKHQSVCNKSLENISLDTWQIICGDVGHVLSSEDTSVPTSVDKTNTETHVNIDVIRNARLKRFDNILLNENITK